MPSVPQFYLRIRLDFSLGIHFHLRSTGKVVFCAKADDVDQIAIRNRKKGYRKARPLIWHVFLIEGLALNFSAYNA